MLETEKELLKKEIIDYFEQFTIIANNTTNKENLKQTQVNLKNKQLKENSEFILKNIDLLNKYLLDGTEIDITKIKPKIMPVVANSLESVLYKLCELIFWSTTNVVTVGRTLKFLVIDEYHNTIMGLIGLQSIMYNLKKHICQYLDITDEATYLKILNQGLLTQRLGSFPPYNDILGGKLITLLAGSQEIVDYYKTKYKNTITQYSKQLLKDPELLFLLITSAYGKSSIYNRIKYKDKLVVFPIGYTKGYGTSQFTKEILKKMKIFLHKNNISYKQKTHIENPLQYINKIGRLLNLPNITHHGIPREIFIYPLVENLKEVVKNNDVPVYFTRTIEDITEYWKQRYCYPRDQRKPEWKNFKKYDFLQQTKNRIYDLTDMFQTQFEFI